MFPWGVEFNTDIVNIYKGMNYFWEPVQKEFGTVFLPRLY
jgi:hypothetical protein